MFYCLGEHCSKRNYCFQYMPLHINTALQASDKSSEKTNGSYACGDFAEYYYFFRPVETWADKCEFENYNSPAHAEGIPIAPGHLITIQNAEGDAEIIPFDPETLKLSTIILDWNR